MWPLSVQARRRPDAVVAGALLTRLAPGAILGLIPAASGFESPLGPFVLARLCRRAGSDDRALPGPAPLLATGTRVPLRPYPPVIRAEPTRGEVPSVSAHRPRHGGTAGSAGA